MNTRKYIGSVQFYKTALGIAIPVMLQVLLQNLVSLIDNFMVAGLGDIKMSGVNVTNQILFVFFVAMNTLVAGGGIFMSQYNGAKNSEGMQQTFRYKLFSGLVLGGIAICLSVFLPNQILGLLVNKNTAGPEIIHEGKIYLGIILFTFIPIAVSAIIGSSLREIGNVRPPLYISVFATVVNTFFNWILIYGNLGAPRLEVAGAAIATVIARVVEMLIFIVYIYIKRPPFYVRFTELLRINFTLFFSILRKSVIIFLSEMSWVMTETVMTAVYNGRGGAEIVSGMAAGWAIANLFFLVFSGIHTSVGVIVGGTLGSNDLETARKQARWLRTGSIVMGFIVAIFESFSVLLIPIVFGNLSVESRLLTRNMLWVIAFYMPVWTYLNAQFATARSGGDTIMGAWVDISVNLTLFLPGIFLLAMYTDLGPIEMFAIIKLTDFIKIAIASWQLRTERWLKNLTSVEIKE
ncbi:MAG TPA: MATE family efflux transporter [Treponemataceae bacterium]|nr:MATE family efflux transporter [Treponemataceae bacterium]